jgi:hypothetical protein
LSQHRDLHVTSTVLISVALGCAALYWSGRSPAPEPAATAGAPVVPAASVVHTQTSKPEPEVQSAHQCENLRDDGPGGARRHQEDRRQREADASHEDGPELPIVFAFAERSIYTTEDDDQGSPVNVTKRVKEAVITNSSSETLTVTATEINLPTQESSQAQFFLGGGMQKRFGTEQGLKMNSGDQLTLRSSSYRDSVQQIP